MTSMTPSSSHSNSRMPLTASSSSSTIPASSSLKRGADMHSIPQDLEHAKTGFEDLEPPEVWQRLNTALHSLFADDTEDHRRIATESYNGFDTELVLGFLWSEALRNSMAPGDYDMLQETWVLKIEKLVETVTGVYPPRYPALTVEKQRKKGKKKQSVEKAVMPSMLVCKLNIRVGKPLLTHRPVKNLEVPQWNFSVDDSFETLIAQVRSRLIRFNGYRWPDDATIYFAPTKATKQTELVELTEENFQEKFEYGFQNATTRRRSAKEGYVIDLWAYLQSTTTAAVAQTQIRRATGPRIRTAETRIEERLQAPDMANLRENIGPVSRRLWATNAARQMDFDAPGPEPMQPPRTNAFRQCLNIDGQRRELDRRTAAEVEEARAEFKTIHILWGESTVLPVRVNLFDLRTALGLPEMNLVGLGIFEEGNTAGPEADMEDVDHASSDEEGRA